jgi:drug/metabolite transporter (DMT)-like permease
MATLETTGSVPSERERALALSAALVTVSLWASAFVGIRSASRQLSPEALALGRLTIAAVALGLLALVRREPLPSPARVSPLMVTWLACTFGALVCLPFAGRLGRELPHTHASAIGWMVYLALAPMALGFLTWGYALARTTAGRMGSTTYLVTPIAILLGWLLLGEVPPALAVAGGALCLAGVYVAQRR